MGRQALECGWDATRSLKWWDTVMRIGLEIEQTGDQPLAIVHSLEATCMIFKEISTLVVCVCV